MNSQIAALKTRNWFFIIFFLVLGTLFLRNEADQLYKIHQLKTNGVVTTATVVEVIKFKLTEREVVEFTISSGKKVKAVLPVGRYLKLGETVNIIYDLQNSTNVSLADFSHLPAAGLVALLSYVFVFLEIFTGFSDKIKTM
jgi:hypothetical protein